MGIKEDFGLQDDSPTEESTKIFIYFKLIVFFLSSVSVRSNKQYGGSDRRRAGRRRRSCCCSGRKDAGRDKEGTAKRGDVGNGGGGGSSSGGRGEKEAEKRKRKEAK